MSTHSISFFPFQAICESKVFATDKNTKYVLQNAGQNSWGNIYFLNPEVSSRPDFSLKFTNGINCNPVQDPIAQEVKSSHIHEGAHQKPITALNSSVTVGSRAARDVN